MNFLIIVGIAASTILTAAVVRKNTPEIALVLSLTGAVVAAVFALSGVSQLADEAKSMMNSVNPDYFTVPLKALGISILTSVTSKLCEDSGDKAMSFTVAFGGRTAMLLAALPLFSELLELLSEVLKLE